MALDISLTDAGRNSRTGRYGFTRANNGAGDVMFDETAAYAVMSSIASRKRRWWADANHGSDLASLRSVTRLTPSATPSQAVAMALDALAALEPGAANLIAANPTATASIVTIAGIAALDLEVSWKTPGGQPQTKPYRV